MSCPWFDILVHDVHELIRQLLDPVSLLALALSCKTELVYNIRNSYGALTNMLTYGHDDLALQCYPRSLMTVDTELLSRHGALKCLLFVYTTGHASDYPGGPKVIRWSRSTAKNAAENGHLEILMFVLDRGAPHGPLTLKTVAGENGHLSCLAYLHGRFPEWDPQTTIPYVRRGRLSCLIFAHEHGCPWHEMTLWNAAQAGAFDCLKYGYEHGAPNDAGRLDLSAAAGGNVKCLAYVHEKGLEMDQHTVSCAAVNGNIQCLAYLHDNGIEWSPYTTYGAARNGHLDCLIYAHEHGCPWEPYTVAGAVENNQRYCALYALSHGAPMPPLGMVGKMQLQEWMKTTNA